MKIHQVIDRLALGLVTFEKETPNVDMQDTIMDSWTLFGDYAV